MIGLLIAATLQTATLVQEFTPPSVSVTIAIVTRPLPQGATAVVLQRGPNENVVVINGPAGPAEFAHAAQAFRDNYCPQDENSSARRVVVWSEVPRLQREENSRKRARRLENDGRTNTKTTLAGVGAADTYRILVTLNEDARSC